MFLLLLIPLINSFNNLNISINNKNNYFKYNYIYRILSLSSKEYFNFKNKKLILSLLQRQFRIINNKNNNYYIVTRNGKKFLGIDNKNKIIFYNNILDRNFLKLSWKIFKVHENKFIIKNTYNNKFIEENNKILQCINIPNFSSNNKTYFLKTNINFIFDILKLFELGSLKKSDLKIINKEPVDIIIKYIDLYDKKLKRNGINQIKKDFDNEELRYCVRSILENIPWIRKIYILMHGDWAQSPIPIFHK